jgi:hypothetical protein
MQREHRIVLFTLAHHGGATIAVPRNQIFEVHFSLSPEAGERYTAARLTFVRESCLRELQLHPAWHNRAVHDAKIGADRQKFKGLCKGLFGAGPPLW